MSDYANRILLNLMRELSRRHYHTEWESGLEYILWHWLHNESPLRSNDKHRLYIAHTRANGWYTILDENTKEIGFVSTDKWIKNFQEEFDGAVN